MKMVACPATAVIVGAGAQGKVVLENWRSACPSARFVFVDDDATLHGSTILGAEVLGPLTCLGQLSVAGAETVIALGNNRTRLALAGRLTNEYGVAWGTVVSASAVVMPSARVGPGAVVLAGAIVNSDADVGAFAIVNTGAIVEHDSVVERGASLSPGVRSGGRVHVGEGAFLSTGVTLAPRVTVGAWSVVGAGAVVVEDVPARSLAYGVPARSVRALDDDFDWGRLL